MLIEELIRRQVVRSEIAIAFRRIDDEPPEVAIAQTRRQLRAARGRARRSGAEAEPQHQADQQKAPRHHTSDYSNPR